MDAKDATDSAETVDVVMDADAVVVVLVTTAACGQSFFCAAAAALEATDVDAVMDADLAMTAVCGSSFFFAAAVVLVIVDAMAVADVTVVAAVAAMDADVNFSDGPGRSFILRPFSFLCICLSDLSYI